STSFVDGQLSIEVTGNDRVQVSASHGQAVVKFNGRAADLGTVPASQVTKIVVDADQESSGANRIDLSSVTAARFPHLVGATIWGGAGDDTIWGSAVTDLIFGGAGNDYLLGRVGDDILLGGDGNDRLNGGASHDSLEGGNGQDTIIGQAGDDSLFGNAGLDRLNGDNGTDWLEGGDGRDILRGGNGMDSIAGNTPDDIVQDSGWHSAPASPPAIEDSGEDAGDGFAGSEPPAFVAYNAPPPLTISVWSVSQLESLTTMTFMVVLSAAPTSSFTISYATGDGTAIAGSDYTAATGMLTLLSHWRSDVSGPRDDYE
ncbi:MAG: Calx-beta domain-containing protein, partial [Planctomycetaceae bacterium]